MSTADWGAMLKDPSLAGVYGLPPEGPAGIVSAARTAGLAVFEVSLQRRCAKQGFLEAMAAALDFPAWFGANWDALEDCLTDLSWVDAPGYVLLLQNCDDFRADHKDDFLSGLEVCRAAAAEWRDQGVPFWAFVDGSACPQPAPTTVR